MPSNFHVLVLGGGPDRERPVSLKSAAAVAAALREAGHQVTEADITPDDTTALDTPCDVIFPVLHGGWGEGGPLQDLLEQKKVPYIGCGPEAAAAAMDKHAAKGIADRAGVPTPAYQRLSPDTPLTVDPPLVLKPLTEGSSFGVAVCRTPEEADQARERMQAEFPTLLAEQFVEGGEITVGIIDSQSLPPIEIRPAEGFYDYRAKYESDDTTYNFDIDLPATVLDRLAQQALVMFRATGCRHLSRVDFLVDADGRDWFLEINTMPGFTDHSLLPLAAAKVGMPLPRLCEQLVRLALEG